MPKTTKYQHFCPVARSLEVIGEKWSLLIVRDLLRGPQRFTDLQRCLGAITPKWLSLRLRDLQDVGIVERESEEGRREVWYRLTPKGRELAPAIEALVVWGIDHALRAPLPGEHVNPDQTLYALMTYFNRKGRRLRDAASWCVDFAERGSYMLSFDGERWRVKRGDGEADLVVHATAQEWVTMLTAPREERARILDAMRIDGPALQRQDFVRLFASPPASVASAS